VVAASRSNERCTTSVRTPLASVISRSADALRGSPPPAALRGGRCWRMQPCERRRRPLDWNARAQYRRRRTNAEGGFGPRHGSSSSPARARRGSGYALRSGKRGKDPAVPPCVSRLCRVTTSSSVGKRSPSRLLVHTTTFRDRPHQIALRDVRAVVVTRFPSGAATHPPFPAALHPALNGLARRTPAPARRSAA
jgi:hypothetical protein